MEQTNPHSLTLQDRGKLTLSGVSEVISFDDAAVLMRTPLGDLLVQGQQLQLKTLSPEGGNVTVQGEISALSYESPRADGWLSRFFR